jgi:iron(III) transport system substrate-binding protein
MLTAAGTVLILLTGCPPSAPIEVTVSSGQGRQPTTRDEILAQAKREGEVNWYTSLPAEDARKIAEGFMSQFPFITCHVVRSGTFEIVRQVQTEIARGDVTADLLHVLDPGAFVTLQQAGHLYRYQSSQAKYLPPEMRASEYWNACRAVVTVIAVRPDSSLAISKWADVPTLGKSIRVGIKDAGTSGSAYATYYLLREKYGYEFWKRLAACRPRIYRSEDEMLAALEHGEVDVLAGVMANSLALNGRARIIWPQDGVPMVVGPMGILAGAPHPNASKLFVDFLLSHTGQALIRDVTGAYPVRPGLAPPKGLRPLTSVSVLSPRAPWELYTALRDFLQAEYNEIFRPTSE